jgi:hypothetical protein
VTGDRALGLSRLFRTRVSFSLRLPGYQETGFSVDRDLREIFFLSFPEAGFPFGLEMHPIYNQASKPAFGCSPLGPP